jgi:hypothetical protein
MLSVFAGVTRSKILFNGDFQTYRLWDVLNMADAKSPQSQSITGSSISGSQVAMAQAQGGSVSQVQQGNYSAGTAEKQLTVPEVVSLLNQIGALLKDSGLPAEVAEKARRDLGRVVEDVQDKEPDKEQAAKSLKKVADALKAANETANSGKGLWEAAQPILLHLVGWFGMAKAFWGLP